MRILTSSGAGGLAPSARLLPLSVLICLFVLAWPASAAQADATVGPEDSERHIQAVLDDLESGEVLRMLPGRYAGLKLVLDRPGITIEAEGAVMDGAAIEIAGGALERTGQGMAFEDLPWPLDPFQPRWLKRQAAREAPTSELQAREVLWICEAGDAARQACVPYERRPPGERLRDRQFASDGDRLQVGEDGGDWSRRVLLWPQTPVALTCTSRAEGVTIRGLTVRRYAPSFHMAQVDLSECAGTTLERVSIVESSSIGLQPGNNFRAIESHFDDNGQMGVVGWAQLMTFENSTANRNNWREFPGGWNAGGVKVNAPGSGVPVEDPGQAITRLVWIGGEVAENRGHGIWTDGSAYDPLIRGALIRDNTGGGVHIELTFKGLVEDNILRGNGADCSKDKASGSAILIQGTVDAVVRNNRIEVTTACGRGINLRQRNTGHWQTARNQIVDNTIVQVSADPYGTNGFWIVQNGDPSIEGRVRDNLIDRNTYVLAERDAAPRWLYATWKPTSGGLLTWEQWQARGYDVNGRLVRVPDPAAWAAGN